MPAISLVTLCQRAAARNPHEIYDVTDLPFHVVEPILNAITNPAQLREIEQNCDQIGEHTGKIWQKFIKRDVPRGEEKMLYPANPRSWHKVYSKMMRQDKRDQQEAEEKLQKAMQGVQEQKAEKRTVYVNQNLLSKTRPKEFADGVRNHTAAQRKPRPSVKEDAFGSIKRASQKTAAQKQNIFKPKYTPANLPSAKSQIKAAPKSMMMDYQRPTAASQAATQRLKELAPPKTQVNKVFAPSSGLSRTDKAVQDARWKEQRDRENRLKAFTTGLKPSSPASSPSPGPAAPTANTVPAARPSATSTARPPTIANSTSRPTAMPQARNLTAAPGNTASPLRLSTQPMLTDLPSPPSTASPQKRPSPVKRSSPPRSGTAPPPMVKRKRPVDPFMPAKKGRH